MKDFVHREKERDIKDFLFAYEVLIKFTGNQVYRKEEVSACRIKGQRFIQQGKMG